MKKNYTVTIGIPAYNEEANIAKILISLTKQRQKNWKLKTIIVYSDASTDQTEEIAGTFVKRGVRLIRGNTRRGQIYAQNYIFKSAKTDIVILLNADVVPDGNYFIESLIKPIQNDPSVGLVGARVTPVPATWWFEDVINHSHMLKQELYENYLGGQHVFSCHGRARAFSKSFYTRLKFPRVIAEDAYSYLACLAMGFKFIYEPRAQVRFKSPTHLLDHLRQSTRFYRSKKDLADFFPRKMIESTYTLPRNGLLYAIARGLKSSPLKTLCYIFILIFAKLVSYFLKPQEAHIWDPAMSSKEEVA